MSLGNDFSIQIKQVRDYQFRVEFGKEGMPDLLMDEPAPLGGGTGPNPSDLLAAAVGKCLCASFLFCARKARLDPREIRADVRLEYVRNERNLLRIGRIKVVLDPGLSEADHESAGRCAALFEDYCIVTQSVRQGITVDVEIAGFPRGAETTRIVAS